VRQFLAEAAKTTTSTLLHILKSLDSPTSGETWPAGHRVDTLSGSDLGRLCRSKVGFIFQTPNLVSSLMAFENVAIPQVRLADRTAPGVARSVGSFLDA
jgi:putative ABC transport system ATP-binding protein